MIKIALSCGLYATNESYWEGSLHQYVNDTYVKAVLDAGAAPVIIPATDCRKAVSAVMEDCDGLILTGGCDISPLEYNEDPLPKLGTVTPRRDRLDRMLCDCAYEMKKPILGICRGMQFLNVYLGGTLYQDVHYYPCESIQHSQKSPRNETSHPVVVREDSWLYSVIGEHVLVNSWHHQIINQLAPSLTATAHSNDGVIEAFESMSNAPAHFIVGVQWHPEELHSTHVNMAKLFASFVDVCRDAEY
ncbi:MAG: gamma-glutamyl-gamma-aminobutyrate hydrolase family protein [Clostridiaceae bacterium]|jgi:putative glutamine amidotransferase|nr:gamma-glutamyl-gamma-aminobutyrate hydrolase family protein [Clostridiaceae bacterium]